jgi:hypothetical protein
MTTESKPLALIGGPYHAPLCKVGDTLACAIRGDRVVSGISDAPIPWPLAHSPDGGYAALVVCGDLVRAVKTESGLAVAYWWGVHPNTVVTWRRALKVGRMTPGTTAVWSETAGGKFAKRRR